MLNKLVRKKVDSTFHLPSVHGGMSYIGDSPTWKLKPTRGAFVRMYAESESNALNDVMSDRIKVTQSQLTGPTFEIRSSPVVLEKARFVKNWVQISNRLWLSGASGYRIRKRYEQQNTATETRETLRSYFYNSRKNRPINIPCYSEQRVDSPVAIELRNGFNYYHVTAESLGSLAHFVDDNSRTPINLHVPNRNVKPFIRSYINTVFPSLSERVRFVARPHRYDKVRSVYNHDHFLYLADEQTISDQTSLNNVDRHWLDALRDPINVHRANLVSYSSSLRLLREAAFKAVSKNSGASTPRLVWMCRDERGDARSRGLSGDDILLSELKTRNCKSVIFERLTPMEQIQTMQNADIVVAPHGAGLANMIYAKTNALIIEIGHRQIQLHRWGDFLKCAHVSACRYATVFADIHGVSNSYEVPHISQGLCGVRIGKRARKRILHLVDEELHRLHGK